MLPDSLLLKLLLSGFGLCLVELGDALPLILGEPLENGHGRRLKLEEELVHLIRLRCHDLDVLVVKVTVGALDLVQESETLL